MGLVSAVMGFVGDVLSPLGEFAPYVAGLSVLVAIGSLVALVR